MQFTLHRDSLVTALGKFAAFAPRRKQQEELAITIVAGEALTLFAASESKELVVALDVPAMIAEPGESSFLWGDLLRIAEDSSQETMSFSGTACKLCLSTADAAFTLVAPGNLDEATRGKAFMANGPHDCVFRAEELCRAIRRTVYACDSDSSRYALGGILLELFADGSNNFIATDGRRLVRQRSHERPLCNGDPARQAIIPAAALERLAVLLPGCDLEQPVALAIGENDCRFSAAGIALWSRLVEGRFPKWRDVYPRTAGATTVTLLAGDFLGPLRQAKTFTSEGILAVKFAVAAGKLTLFSGLGDHGEGRIEVAATVAGPDATVFFQPVPFIDLCESLSSLDTLTLHIGNKASVCFACEDSGLDLLCMPVEGAS